MQENYSENITDNVNLKDDSDDENQSSQENEILLDSFVDSDKLNVLNDANFTIKCEIGEVNLSFRELENLKIGDSIEFIKWPGKVKLRLNNLVFAEGYLVEINDMLGVKITNRYAL